MLRVLRWREFAIFYFFNAEIYTTFWKQIRNIESTKCLRFNVFFHIEFFLFCTVLLVALWQWIDGKVKKNRCCINEVYSRFIYYILYKRIVFYIELCIRMSVFYVFIYIIHKTPPLYRLKCVFFFSFRLALYSNEIYYDIVSENVFYVFRVYQRKTTPTKTPLAE